MTLTACLCVLAGDRLLDIPCKVCGDRSSGKHYGIYSCDGKEDVYGKQTCLQSYQKVSDACPQAVRTV
jgi:hypothetical protein